MALLFNDGYDHYGTTVALLVDYWTSFDTASKSLVSPRLGSGKALRIATFSTAVVKELGVNAPTLICGVAVKPVSLPPTAMPFPIALLMDAATPQLYIGVINTGHLVVYRGVLAALLFTSTNVMTAGTWYHVEIKATIHNSAGAFEVRVNGSSVGWVPAQTAQNTRASANNYANRFGHSAAGLVSNSGSFDFDDLYVLDTSGSRLNDFLGDSKITTVFPDANGATIQWTPTAGNNFECVDNNPPVDSTYVANATAGQRDLYDVTNLADGAIHAATLLHRASKSDAGARSIQTACRSGGTVFLGTTHALGTSFVYYSHVYAVDPNTSAQWTLANLNSAQFGQDTV